VLAFAALIAATAAFIATAAFPSALPALAPFALAMALAMALAPLARIAAADGTPLVGAAVAGAGVSPGSRTSG
jgi:hypothetical protein